MVKWKIKIQGREVEGRFFFFFLFQKSYQYLILQIENVRLNVPSLNV